MALNRFAEARAVYQQAQARGVSAGEVDRSRYQLAFLEGDSAMMASLATALSKEPAYEFRAFSEQSKAAAYVGHLAAARELSRQSAARIVERKDPGLAAEVEADESVRESLFGNSAEARRHLTAAMKVAKDPSFYAMALALAGEPASASKVVDQLASQVPPDGFMDKVAIPEARGAIELKRGNPGRALQLLAPAQSTEAGWYDPYMPAYLRGEALLALHRGQEAATEFEKIINHRGAVGYEPVGALAPVGLARAYALKGDTANARAAYRDYLTLWKDADPDIPILKQAQAEYAKLN